MKMTDFERKRAMPIIKYNRLLSFKSGKMFLIVGEKNETSKNGVWLIGYMAPYFSEKVMIYFCFDDFPEYVEDERLLYNPSLESFDDYRARLAKLFDRALSEE